VSVPESSVSSLDLLALIADVGGVTVDGPIGAPIPGEDGQPDTYAWIHADIVKETVYTVEIEPVAEAEHTTPSGRFLVARGSLTEAKFGRPDSMVVQIGGRLGVAHAGVIEDPALFDTLREGTPRFPAVRDGQIAAFERMRSIAEQVIAFNL